MKVYLDACCLSRLTDDQTQLRIRQEAQAVEQIFKQIRDGTVDWMASEVLLDEIGRNPTTAKRVENLILLALASEVVEVHEDIARRSRDLLDSGYGVFDGLHLASAEAGGVDVLLTTDSSGRPLVVMEVRGLLCEIRYSGASRVRYEHSGQHDRRAV